MKKFLFYFFIFYFIILFLFKNPKNIKNYLPKKLEKNTSLVFFDNGIGSYWFCENEINKKIIICFRGFKSFEEEEVNCRQIEKLFLEYQIVYIEFPGIGISQNCFYDDQIQIINELYQAYLCILRLEKWEKIGFIGFDYGSVIQSMIYNKIEENIQIKPNWIIQINGFSSMESLVLFKYPWYLQLFFRNKKKFESSQNYKKINIPLYIFHSKNNKLVPFLESIKLHLLLKPKSKFISLYGDENFTLLSKENIKIIKNFIAVLK